MPLILISINFKCFIFQVIQSALCSDSCAISGFFTLCLFFFNTFPFGNQCLNDSCEDKMPQCHFQHPLSCTTCPVHTGLLPPSPRTFCPCVTAFLCPCSFLCLVSFSFQSELLFIFLSQISSWLLHRAFSPSSLDQFYIFTETASYFHVEHYSYQTLPIFFFWPHKACKTLVSPPGIKPTPSAVEAGSLNHQPSRVHQGTPDLTSLHVFFQTIGPQFFLFIH